MNRKEFTKYLNETQDESLYGSLAAHDRRFHPNGYQEGDSCEVREKLGKTDKPDEDVNQDNGDPNERTTRLAPNGKRSNLTNRQYDQVRTPEFKKWFGDWENDPEHASKVVDENGEPMVVYAGSPDARFNEFNTKRGAWFAKSLEYAKEYEKDSEGKKGEFSNTRQFFLSIRNPLNLGDISKTDTPQRRSEIEKQLCLDDGGLRDKGLYEGETLWELTWEKKFVDISKSSGFDGFESTEENRTVFVRSDTFCVFNASQIKSATDNNGSFSVESDDIRDEAMGKVKKYLDACVEDETAIRKFCLISDIHETPLTSIDAKDADIVVIAGDFMGGGNDSDDAGAAYLIDRFFPWCRKNSDKEIVLTAGNHDKFLYRLWERRAEIDWPKNVTYLIDEPATISGLKFYGTPWCRKDREGRFELDDKTLKYMFGKIPSGLDVLIVHTPPTVKGSNIDWSDWSDEHEGSSELAKIIHDKQPRLVVCGHVHGGSRSPVMIGKSKVINVARVKDHRDEVACKPVFIDLPVRK